MAKTEEIKIPKLGATKLNVELIGISDLILNKKSRSYELQEVFRQTNPKGTKIPAKLSQPYSLWEHLITSITWRDAITFHDDDYQKYTEDEWKEYMRNNAPCILRQAFVGSMAEAFKTFGYKGKEGTGKDGTDLKRAVNFDQPIYPISFANVGYEQKLIPNTGISKTNVVGQYNIFNGWRCNISFTFPERVFPVDTMIELLGVTGEYVGVGTQRKNGYGRWEIGKIERYNI